MKLYKLIIVFLPLMLISISCGGDSSQESGDAATSGEKTEELRDKNIAIAAEQTKNRFPCDTIALRQYVLDTYDAGTSLLMTEPEYTYSLPRAAVVYYKEQSDQYVFALLTTSKAGERIVEPKNITGFSSSYINLDSTKLGTALMFLVLFKCDGESFSEVWRSEVPIHGGFRKITLKTWKPKNIKYIELNYEDGIISGHRNYNFFMVDGLMKPPHLMETYIALVHKRTMADVNNDKYPDYYEYRFIDSTRYIRILDSIPFYWSQDRKLYITKANSRWFRKY